MQSKATLRYLRIAPRKVRLVAELIRGKKASEANAILRFCTKNAADPLQKALRAALAAAQNFQLDEANLYIARLDVQEGSKLKRYRPRARGRAYPIQKKTSHITMVLDEIVPTAGAKKKQSAQNPKDIGAAAPQLSKAGLGGKPKFRAEKEIAQAKRNARTARFFRRKTV
ncbi:MAG: 50S ribosomal protein L22 [Candidatus Wildermuthbacteria bacterium RIFCSPLOWO2_01_FULL_48_29]|uniref:Large ribosomal subunit protein uL22 n=2 Tax=Candidatus Wildermuthiibacteriota TaxID=1817923 RepID=A0A1G2RNY2_9BACT|nr:MAG: 50S ribosomal protein L22 [Candidatus Wildermuthbacteria bacterium RIFCSPHIGHO2_01_FULL_48_27b]OHA74178.1 MAG: 50S ribosomal protein L22 [Candidatus Wildermuthbacteria bacterium RIFCSPLOWO2_01_FULL_48_29]